MVAMRCVTHKNVLYVTLVYNNNIPYTLYDCGFLRWFIRIKIMSIGYVIQYTYYYYTYFNRRRNFNDSCKHYNVIVYRWDRPLYLFITRRETFDVVVYRIRNTALIII